MRKRSLPAKPLGEARAALLRAARPLESREIVRVEDAGGRISAEAVVAASSVPHYHGSAMDGIAVRAEDTFGASEADPVVLSIGSPETTARPFVYVDTGNALPPWANAVVMIERVHAGGFPLEGTAAPEVEVRVASIPWQHVRLVGEDIVAGEPIVARGHRLRPVDVAALLAAGVERVAVRPRPIVAILPTGDELIEPGEELRPGRIVEFNSRMLASFVREWGGEPRRLAPVRDDLAGIRSRIESALDEADVVCVIAGSSAGRHDFTVEALAGVGEILAHGIEVMPGKPAILAAIQQSPRTRRASVAVGVPGYPVSAAVVCRELLEPLIAHLLGTARSTPQTVRAVTPRRLGSRLGSEELVRVTMGKVGDRLIVSSLGRGAGAISTMAKADGLVRIPSTRDAVEEGEEVEVELLRPLDEVLGTILVAGDPDLALGVLEDALKESHPQYKLAVSSAGGRSLLALARDEAHLAAVHQLDPTAGLHDLSDVARLLDEKRVVVVNLLAREQGLLVVAGNPLGLHVIGDLARHGVRFVNRQRGSGSRALLDHLLDREGIAAEEIRGYEREAQSHMAAAVAVRSGLADVGLGVESAARALGLDFVPIMREDYDLVLRADFAESDPGLALLEVIRGARFREALARLPGSDTARTGEQKRSRLGLSGRP